MARLMHPTNMETSNLLLFIEYRLLIKTSTWVRDSHELFDYESPHLMKRTFKIQHSSNHHIKKLTNHNLGGVIRDDTEMSVVSEREMLALSMSKESEKEQH